MQRIAIIGAGASGCFAAANVPAAGDTEVVVYEKTGKAMQKVKVSGGGRCNTTHSCFDIPELLNRYPRGKQLLKKSLHRFGPQQTIDWFAARGVQLKTEADGRMFPVSDDSQTIIDCIWQEMMRRKVQVFFHKSVVSVQQKDGKFLMTFADTSVASADVLMIATGGFPKAEQYKWITALGHTIEQSVPSLFTFNMPGNPVTELMGVSVPDAVVKISGTKISSRGPLLITHWGMSGPAILKTSAIAARELADRQYTFTAMVNWLGEMSEADLKEAITVLRKEQGKQMVWSKSPFELPRRLWEYQLKRCGIAEQVRWGDLPAQGQNKLVEHLLRDAYPVAGKTTFKEEFVTCGGINLKEIDPQTMESRVVPGLYFGGELMDVDGITGGYNFQHAWSSGCIAAHSMAAKHAETRA